jgi:hypothetical protein
LDTDIGGRHQRLTYGHDTWRARCVERRTPGSAGGPQKPTSGNVGRALRSDPTERQTSKFCFGPPRVERVERFDNEGRKSIMEIVHSRCAGMDVSKRDAKVCVRVAGRGRRKTVETVRTWGATTNAILALREHLINEQVSLVVMEATGDYGKPFYYLLENAGFELMLVNPRQVKNLPGARAMSPTRPGWPSSARTVWSAARSSHPPRPGSCGI